MNMKRQELLRAHQAWIKPHIELAKDNLATGKAAWGSVVEPIVEVCQTREQLDLFRICRYYWSSPYSEYVGRRIKLLIRDNALHSKPLIGIAALGSSIVHIPERDLWVGWDTPTRTKNLIYTMDAYVLGAMPPYNDLLGGKLISYLVASNEVRDLYAKKYRNAVTNIAKRKANRLACVFTTSLYGKSSQYNRLRFGEKQLYVPIGKTKGYGTLHLTDETFNALLMVLEENDLEIANNFGDGPVWRMRVIRAAAGILGFNADFLLQHSFQREIYAVSLASNTKEFLTGQHKKLLRCDYPMDELRDYWRRRWLTNRKKHADIRDRVISFDKSKFEIR
jgi:hypothetical protein